MRFRVLGPLRIWDGSTWLPVRAPQQRVVLALLLIEAGQLVTADRLAYEIWGDRPPRTAANTIQAYVARLRRLLGSSSSPLVTRDRGYELVIDQGQLDSQVFEHLLESGQRDLAARKRRAAAGQLGDALRLWHGSAMSDVPITPSVTVAVARLEQRRLTALEVRLGVDLDLGRHVEVVDELQRLVDDHPLREGLRGHLMLALYRCGRRGEALEVYQRGRAVLVRELGVEPGPELQELSRAILADDRRLTVELPVQAGRTVPAQLPSDTGAFTGRIEQLSWLDGVLHDAATTVVVAISGSAGVGKTALAVHWAHHVRDRFGDGQLYVNLRGYAGGEPVRPIAALTTMLRALGVPAEQMPTDVEEAAGMYRSLLADRRTLIMLDDARHADQIRPLLPGAAGCCVLVTSRDALTGLVARNDAHVLSLGVLTPTEAHALLGRLLGTSRVNEEPDGAHEMARLCAHLPLALRIAAANLVATPGGTIGGYVALLRADDRLAALEVGGDSQAAVRVAFDLSYAALPSAEQRMFRLLGEVPGEDFTPEAAAALAGRPVVEVQPLLDSLSEAHLIGQHATGRYTFHDLLRVYANSKAEAVDTPAERRAALARLHNWYLSTVDRAATLLYPHMLRLDIPRTPTVPAKVEDHSEALAWLDTERSNLVSAITRAAATASPGPEVSLLADSLRGYFYLRMHLADWLAVAHAGLAAGEAQGDLKSQAAAYFSHSDAAMRQGRREQAIDYSTRALDLARRAGWLEGQATTLGNLGNVHLGAGQLGRANEHYQQALELNRATGRITGQANILGNLGFLQWQLGHLGDAANQCAAALRLHQQTGSRHGEALNYGNLGEVQHDLGLLPDAARHLAEALALHRQVGDRGGEADVLNDLAAVNRDLGEDAHALELAHTALALARDAGDRYSEGDALNTLGTIQHHLARAGDAEAYHRQALEVTRETGYRYPETEAYLGLASATLDLDPAETALSLASTAGFDALRGHAQTVIAEIMLHRSEPRRAVEYASRALRLQEQTGHRLGQAQAHRVLCRALPRVGDHDLARTHREKALAVISDMGMAVAGGW